MSGGRRGRTRLATVLERAGRIDEAREALERSLAIWERKGCLPGAESVREQIQSLGRAQVAESRARERSPMRVSLRWRLLDERAARVARRDASDETSRRGAL